MPEAPKGYRKVPALLTGTLTQLGMVGASGGTEGKELVIGMGKYGICDGPEEKMQGVGGGHP